MPTAPTDATATAERDRLVVANVGLVPTIARDFLGRGLPLDDLIGAGYLGLIRAATDFDPTYGVKFGTYARWWIAEAIRGELVRTARPVRLPKHADELLRRHRTLARRFADRHGRPPTPDEAADLLGLDDAARRTLADALAAAHGRVGYDEAWNAIDGRMGPEDEVGSSDEIEALGQHLRSLDPRERRVIERHFGLGDSEPASLKAIGRELGLSPEWVRKIERDALGKLRGRLDEGDESS